MDAFEELLARAKADPAVVGLVLTGSQARGTATVHSDHDVYVVVRARDERWRATRRSPELLTTVFALHGRLRPYNTYLRWELETYPLPAPWTAADLPARALGDPVGLFPDVARLARDRGHGDVLDAWGDDLALLIEVPGG
ncbi:nucleotidyltransferase domain-containing protein [Micromonospora yasonensis]|uniref:nucleotidyltransferase domain-containing protein n=1 Tax=Micromonospora yasonensis TaxID=1128667 RepID=UPI00222E2712|nr:nucleotidyltransferase domain-containing protein [Micromonospora yasonensis]MCW3843185.1 nucleotidyltransferase domain-containing protein [Micromonospora yasonensis]